MKALEILKKYQDEIQTSTPSEIDLVEAIEELGAIENNIKSSIEEIKYALAKPEYATVYLNNALRFLNEKQYNM